MITHCEASHIEDQDGPLPILRRIHIRNPQDEWMVIDLKPPAMEKPEMSTHNEIFNAFVEAQKALDELPSARAKIDELQRAESILTDAVHNREEQIAKANDTIADLTAKLAEARKAADDATFRELQARDHLETLVKVIHGAADTSNTAKAFLEPPRPEPEVPLAQTEANSTSAFAQDGSQHPVTTETSAGTTDANTSHSEGQSESFPTPSQSAPDASTTGSTTGSEPSGGSDFGFIETHIGEHTIIEPTRGEAIVGIDPFGSAVSQDTVSTGAANVSSESGVALGESAGPFASTEGGQSPVAVSAEQRTGQTMTQTEISSGITSESSNAPSPADASRPNFGMPYWTKPTHMTWRQWQAQGNNVPNWINTDQMDSH